MSSMTLQPLFAADFIQLVIYGIVFIVWILGQVLGGRKNAQQKKQPPLRPQQPQPVDMAEGVPQPNDQRFGDQRMGNQGPRNQPQNQEDALRNEVEDFLRRAQGKPPKPRQEKRPRPTPQPERKRPLAPIATLAPAVSLQEGHSLQESHSLRDEGVAEHVARHISTQDIAAHTQTLGAEVATADDQLESRLHEKFDHNVGRLEHRESSAKREEADIAAEVAAMLRSPEGMRQLIVANEILRRPEW